MFRSQTLDLGLSSASQTNLCLCKQSILQITESSGVLLRTAFYLEEVILVIFCFFKQNNQCVQLQK